MYRCFGYSSKAKKSVYVYISYGVYKFEITTDSQWTLINEPYDCSYKTNETDDTDWLNLPLSWLR